MTLSRNIFISHIVQEKPIALTLQRYLEEAFGREYPVFVSSDHKSIGGGRPWFNHILENLRQADVVIALLSQESVKREWVNFEAGAGEGAGALVIPVTVKGFDFSKVSFPLAGYNGRPIGDIGGLLFDIARRLKHPSTPAVDSVRYLEDILAAETSVTYKSVTVRPFIFSKENTSIQVRYKISNSGNADLELIMLEAWVPSSLISSNWALISHHNTIDYSRQDPLYLHASYSTVPSTQAQSLRPVLTPSMGEIQLLFPRFVLSSPDASQLDLFIEHHIHVRNHSTQREAITLGSLLQA